MLDPVQPAERGTAKVPDGKRGGSLDGTYLSGQIGVGPLDLALHPPQCLLLVLPVSVGAPAAGGLPGGGLAEQGGTDPDEAARLGLPLPVGAAQVERGSPDRPLAEFMNAAGVRQQEPVGTGKRWDRSFRGGEAKKRGDGLFECAEALAVCRTEGPCRRHIEEDPGVDRRDHGIAGERLAA